MRRQLQRWPSWIAYFTSFITLVLGVLGLAWSLGIPGYPFGTGDPDMVNEGAKAIEFNLLGLTTPDSAGPIIALLGGVGALVALAMARGVGQGAARALMLGFAAVAATALSVGIQDYRPLILVAYTPILLVSKLVFGKPDSFGFSDLYSWPTVALTICLLAGVAWALTAVAYRRLTSGACSACGGPRRKGSAGIARWGVPAVTIAVVTPLIYAATRWLWALGFSLGVDAEMYRQGQEEGLWLIGACLATSGALGAILTLGLVQRWGEVFPRWMVGLGGRRVPPMLAVVPATLVAVLVTAAGMMYIRVVAVEGVADHWATHMPETLWPVWGVALFVAAMAYHDRRRGACEVCGQEETRLPAPGDVDKPTTTATLAATP